MKPTVGRDVHYVGPWGGCQAAKVVGVHMSEVLVDLCVLGRTSIEFRQEIALGNNEMGNTWHWPERVEE